MAPESRPQRKFEGILHAERLYTFHGAVLDHGVPVLAAALRETEHISVNKDRLLRAGLEPGPWLRDLKQAVRRCLPDDGEITATLTGGGEKTCTIADLSAELLLRSPGQRIAYVTDMHNTPDNVEKVLDLAKDADLLVCETAFLHEDRGLARERMHLTARDAGEIARAADARRLAPFHLSPRYKGREDEIVREAADAFGGPVLTLTNTGASRTVPHGAVSRG
jgi:ribonuclease Z